MLAVLGDRTAPTLRLRTLQSQSQPEEEDEAEEDEAEELGHTEVYADYVPSKCECRPRPRRRPCMPRGAPLGLQAPAGGAAPGSLEQRRCAGRGSLVTVVWQ